MKAEEKFTPPYPAPHKNKIDRFKRLFHGMHSWIHTLYEKSYTMKAGEVKLPKLRMVIVNEKEAANAVMNDRSGKFPKHRVQHEMLCPLLGESVFSTNGEKWREQREMINPAFAHANLKKTFETMEDAALELCDDLARDQAKADFLHIDPYMTHVTADVIFRTILSRKLDKAGARAIHDAFNKYQSLAQRITNLQLYGLPTFFLKPLLRRHAAAIHKVFAEITRERYETFHAALEKGETPPNNDILDALMIAKSPKTGARFGFQDIIDQLAIIFLAGHETSASALTWSLYLAARCPHLQQAARQEVAEFTDASGKIPFEHVKKLKTVDALFQEALRLYPPVSFYPREATEVTNIRNKTLAPGDMVTISPWLLGRNGNYWQEPHVFNPDRFLTEEERETIKDCHMPFGKGPRICIGAGFAKQEAALILAHIFRRFTVELKPGDKVEPVSRMTTRPKNGVRLRFKEA